ncbi:hypothetical protein [Dyella sp. GSA-30]|uniref:DUF7009 family protein n=1 Tax=Dyella sp. GSA-30 TaxID=2994496 RepID=UPI002490F385|nr:hypothetical protein [Dyella sp. GSA-30]BDU21923.1 hypothetical protein DYGSA30_33800 [Dyella sp. GSA-30]
MKLQIEGQHLRVRIGEEELAQLLAGQAIEAMTQFAEVFAVRYSLELTPADTANLSGSPAAWRIAIPEERVREHVARLPTREGLQFALPGEREEDNLQLLFDVDVRDSVRRRR